MYLNMLKWHKAALWSDILYTSDKNNERGVVMALVHVVPGLSEEVSEKAIEILQGCLSHEQETALILKHAHWNVVGPNFIAVHEMLDPQVHEMLEDADETAERIATLGGSPLGRATDIVEHCTWKPFALTGRVSTEEYLQALDKYYEELLLHSFKAAEELNEYDFISSNMVQDHTLNMQKFQWFVRSHLVK